MPANIKLQEKQGPRVPVSLSHADGSMNTTDKSKCMHTIESLLGDSTAPTDVDVCIVDATFLQHAQNNPPQHVVN